MSNDAAARSAAGDAPAATPEMTEVRDARLAVRRAGEGPAFVWGHGLMGSMDLDDASGLFAWEDLHDCAHVVRYDARGHGESSDAEEAAHMRWDNLAADMLALTAAIGADTTILGGASMGCATALHAAVMEPDRVDGLVLVIPPTAWRTRPRQQRLYRMGARVIGLVGGAPLARVVGGASAPAPLRGEHSAVFDAMVDNVRHADRKRTPVAMRGAAHSDLPVADAVRELQVPALILSWEGDPTHPRSTAERLGELMPAACWQHAETPEDLSRWPVLVRDFINDVNG